MLHFRIALCLQITVLAFADEDVTTTKEESETLEASTTLPDDQKKPFTCEENSQPFFLVTLRCAAAVPGFLISDRWVLGQADELLTSCKGQTCSVGRSNEETVNCKEIFPHEKFNASREILRYNIALVSTENPIPTWSNLPVPWPRNKGFTSKCTEIAVYARTKCWTQVVVSRKKCMKTISHLKPSSNESYFCAKFKDPKDQGSRITDPQNVPDLHASMAVCQNVVVGVFSFDVGNRYFFTKIQDYYTFIRETSSVGVPFESSPGKGVEKESEGGKDSGKKEARSAKTSSASSQRPCFLVFAVVFLLHVWFIYYCFW